MCRLLQNSRFFLEIAKAWRKNLKRVKRTSLTGITSRFFLEIGKAWKKNLNNLSVFK